MSFWGWVNENNNIARVGRIKRYIVFLFVFLVAPVMIYALIKWDPLVGDRGEGLSLGMWAVLILYWVAASFVIKRYEAKRRLMCILDWLFEWDDDDFENLIAIVKKRRREQDKSKISLVRDEERVRWLGIS